MKKRFLSILLAMVMAFSILPTASLAAGSVEEALGEIDIYNGGQELSYLMINGRVRTLIYTYYNYVNAKGEIKEIPAYCVNPNTTGVPQTVDVGESIEYLAEEKTSDPKVLGIVANGYPTRSLEELGLENKYQGYYATKMALWCYLLSNWDINNLKVNSALSGVELQRAQKMLAAAKDIYARGTAWNEVLSPEVTCTPDRDTAYEVTIDGKQYKQQVFTFWSKTWVCDYAVEVSFTDPGSVPRGTRIVDIEELSSDGSHVIDTPPQTVYLSGENQEVVQVYFGNSPKGSLLIKKVSSADNSPISDVQFFVTESDGTVVGDSNGYFVTDSAGTILIEGIDPGTTLVVKETRAKDGFLLDDTPQTAQIQAGQTVTLEFRNQPTGQLIIHKLSGNDKKTPLEGVQFKITYSDGSFVDADSGQLSSNGLYWSNSAGQIILSGLTGTVVVTEVESIPGYTIDPNTQSQTVVINPNDTQELYFYNNPIGGIEIIKVNASKTSERIPDTTFEIRRMDDALVDTITTDRNGRAYLSLEDGSYYALEVEANPDFVLDDTPHYFEVKNGEVTTLRIKNEANSGILIHKVDTSGEGIYGVKFLLYDEDRNPIGEFTSDDEGWVYITADDLPDGANTSGRFYLRELEAAEGYILDEEYKTVYVRPGRTAEIEWVNTAITGQIQIWKKSADDNPINGFPAGTPLEGAVFGIYNKANALVDTVESDSRGLAVSKPLPLGRYTVKEISSPQFYSVSDEEVTVYLEHEGQIVQVEYLNESVYTNVSISKSGYTQVVPGQEIRYTFKDIGNNSTVPLDSFYWRDTLPTDAVRLDKIITGTYSARLNYKVVFQTNLNDTQRVLADNLNTQKNYTLDASPAALGLASNEYVTQVTFLFGRVPGGFKQVETPYIYCDVLSSLSHEYRFANKCDVGGMWQNQWVQATDRWVTIIYRGGPVPTLPRTGY